MNFTGNKFKKGDKVYWTNPDRGLFSGEYLIMDIQPCISGEVITLSNGSYELEAFVNEIKKLPKSN